MNKNHYPFIAATIGLILVIALFFAGATSPEKAYALPLLTMLFMCELGVLVTGAGAFIGVQGWLKQRDRTVLLAVSAACAALTIGLLSLGVALWQGTGTLPG